MNIRFAVTEDIPSMCDLIFEHGPNEWNYLPRPQVTEHLNKIASGDVYAILAEDNGAPIGFVTFHPSTSFSRYQPAAQKDAPHGYICEAVVHRGHAGRGLGMQLVNAAVENLRAQRLIPIYVERHEENRASAGMMRKAGFEEIETYDDPDRRSAGSRRTTVCRMLANPR